MWVNGYIQWEHHKRGLKHMKNTLPVRTAAEAELRVLRARRQWRELVESLEGSQAEEGESRLRAELEVERGAVAAAAEQQGLFVAAAASWVETAASWAQAVRAEARQQALHEFGASSTAAAQRNVDEAVAEIRRLEVAPAQRKLHLALIERRRWRQRAKDNAKAARKARRAAAGARAAAAAAKLAAAGPIVVD